MCGLVGFWSANGDRREFAQLASRMADRIRHRGPDDSGTWCDDKAGLTLALRRLSILDLSAAGHQPMQSACGRYVIVFNGEIYNHLELRGRLEAERNAPDWRGHADTETLLAGFAAWGVERTLEATVGMFAIALWDRREHVLTLARDRLGEKPLYYGWQGDTFLFGSELKALRAHPAFCSEIDRGALSLFLRHNYIPGPFSIFQGIRKLPPGTFLCVSLNRRDAEPVPYWSLRSVTENGLANPFDGTEEEALRELERRLVCAVRGQMVADVPLGVLLSGGFDSTTITALMQASSSRPIRTFTIGFGDRTYDEAQHARSVAAHLGTDHTELRLSADDALSLIPAMPQMYDEPFADSSQLPTHLVMRLARRHVTVALSGDGGDEFFGGYNRYVFGPRVWNRIRRIPAPLRRLIGTGLSSIPLSWGNNLAAPLARRIGIAQAGDKAQKLGLRMQRVQSLDDLYAALVSEWPDAERMVIGGVVPPNLLDDRAIWPRLRDPVARMMALDALTYLPDDILVKVDRAAMAVSLETRAPFLDRDVVEFAWTLPMSMKLRDGRGKWILRLLLDRYVPRELVDRPKMGFSIPLDAWLRGPLREWAGEHLAEDRLRREGFLNVAPIQTTWAKHLRGEGSFGYRLWSVLMFEAWMDEQARAA